MAPYRDSSFEAVWDSFDMFLQNTVSPQVRKNLLSDLLSLACVQKQKKKGKKCSGIFPFVWLNACSSHALFFPKKDINVSWGEIGKIPSPDPRFALSFAAPSVSFQKKSNTRKEDKGDRGGSFSQIAPPTKVHSSKSLSQENHLNSRTVIETHSLGGTKGQF